MKKPDPENLLSRRRFIELSAKSVSTVALLGSLPGLDFSRLGSASLRLVRHGHTIRCLAGKTAVCSIPPSAIVEGGPESDVAFEPGEGSRIRRTFRVGAWRVRDEIAQDTPGVFKWRRSWENTSAQPVDADLHLEAESAYAPGFYLIPGASYNGNDHARTSAPGLAKDGVPWIFSSYRATVPGATYSEGGGWSMFLFADARQPSLDSACSLVLRDDRIAHRLFWPVRDNIPNRFSSRGVRNHLPIDPGESFAVVSYLVVCPSPDPHRAWRNGLDVAWRQNRHDIRAWFGPPRLWKLGLQFARESLWYDQSDFTGFNIGLVRKGDAWQQRGEVKYEIGWCGQNAALGTAFVQDYIWNKNEDSRHVGFKALDFWADHGRLDCGLFYTNYDLKLGAHRWAAYNPTFLGRKAKPGEKWVDTCNLGWGAYYYLFASELAGQCGRPRPTWRNFGLDTCNFFVAHALEDGTFGKAWSLEGKCLAKGATTGAHILWPMLKAYRMTHDESYLRVARRAFQTYVDRDLDQLHCTSGALDADTIDRESCVPLLFAALDLHEITGERRYLRDAEMAGYYLATWQWHYSVAFPEGSDLAKTHYDIFGGTDISILGPGLDPWGELIALGWLRLWKATGKDIWRDRGVLTFRQGTIGISDGSLVLNGLVRPAGSQTEAIGLGLSGAERGQYRDWLVAWPSAHRLTTLMHWRNWADFGA